MSKKNHRSGDKFRGRHTTIIDASGPVVDFLKTLDGVKGISIGIISSIKSVSQGSVICNETRSGLEVKVRGNKYIQIFYVFVESNKAQEIKSKINSMFPSLEKGKGKRRKHNKDNSQKKSEEDIHQHVVDFNK
ncbi:MAG: hypothetical protein A2725_01385 [Candidatus Magasanikbacteria bacterium RIFCSPHIGHO2_01_FULL_33_34]|uniref:Uncharacterized protein n=1 Tax=Candidatus Magasanikbacteria bacterium RIFCSPHIGHO2_01_FULL_33_34 TaxID=1798671 RepID=A0A1F6LJ95_9BACT|nr:MAG: hypothetical protein A2725_01385 [Candidatus Magasanikbacteria bacterium RIFCSPHIGHO2_01_FULL_33_34]OGH65470.1 MAG: hypothetical protein A3B83_01140 [Candidatus Magasanikbacteria bacterium RIFCSPHIGHO2_02_FULL_33_17]OGH76180.1 MAG: hypothetical protein A3A89_01960 [Candidatus Magasanikbacteria bacterium RIFCSPLOWO2_01_FULL_33_34]